MSPQAHEREPPLVLVVGRSNYGRGCFDGGDASWGTAGQRASEEDKLDALIVARQLRRNGRHFFVVQSAETLECAFQCLQERPRLPDLIILDIQRQRRSGLRDSADEGRAGARTL